MSTTGQQGPPTLEHDPVSHSGGAHRARPRHHPVRLVALLLALTGAVVTVVALASGGDKADTKRHTNQAGQSPRATGPAPGTLPTPAPTPTDTFLPYSADSFFKSTLDGAPIDQQATVRLHEFLRNDRDQQGVHFPLIRGVDGNAWGTPYAEGTKRDPVWRLTGAVPPEARLLETRGFHAPEAFGDSLTGTSDSPFVVNDMASGWTVWGAKAHYAGNHHIRVRSAGFFEHDSNGLDRRNPRSDSRVNFRSRGAIPDAMVIRHDLLVQAIEQDSDLGHVLHMFFVETNTAAGFVHPMVGEEHGKQGFGAEGLRIAIDPSIDLTRRGLDPAGLAIARTLQHYGAYLGDNAGGPSGLKAQQDDRHASLWGNLLHTNTLKGITWDDFVVIRPGWQ